MSVTALGGCAHNFIPPDINYDSAGRVMCLFFVDVLLYKEGTTPKLAAIIADVHEVLLYLLRFDFSDYVLLTGLPGSWSAFKVSRM